MELNKEIRRALVDVADKDEGILYLLTAYHALDVQCISQATMRQVNACNIVQRDHRSGTLQWNIPLYSNQNTDDIWSWVNDFRDKFKAKNQDRVGTKKTCVARMKQWFRENPQYRKEDILGATDMYLRITDPRYIMKAHKFIFDGAGVMKNSTLLEWVEKYVEREQTNKVINPNRKMM